MFSAGQISNTFGLGSGIFSFGAAHTGVGGVILYNGMSMGQPVSPFYTDTLLYVNSSAPDLVPWENSTASESLVFEISVPTHKSSSEKGGAVHFISKLFWELLVLSDTSRLDEAIERIAELARKGALSAGDGPRDDRQDDELTRQAPLPWQFLERKLTLYQVENHHASQLPDNADSLFQSQLKYEAAGKKDNKDKGRKNGGGDDAAGRLRELRIKFADARESEEGRSDAIREYLVLLTMGPRLTGHSEIINAARSLRQLLIDTKARISLREQAILGLELILDLLPDGHAEIAEWMRAARFVMRDPGMKGVVRERAEAGYVRLANRLPLNHPEIHIMALEKEAVALKTPEEIEAFFERLIEEQPETEFAWVAVVGENGEIKEHLVVPGALDHVHVEPSEDAALTYVVAHSHAGGLTVYGDEFASFLIKNLIQTSLFASADDLKRHHWDAIEHAEMFFGIDTPENLFFKNGKYYHRIYNKDGFIVVEHDPLLKDSDARPAYRVYFSLKPDAKRDPEFSSVVRKTILHNLGAINISYREGRAEFADAVVDVPWEESRSHPAFALPKPQDVLPRIHVKKGDLEFSREEIEGKNRGAILKDGLILRRAVALANGTEAMIVSDPKETHSHVLVRVKDRYLEIEQPVIVQTKTGQAIYYNNNEYFPYNGRIVGGKKKVAAKGGALFIRSAGGAKEHQFLVYNKYSPSLIELPPDGVVIDGNAAGVNGFLLLYRGNSYVLSGKYSDPLEQRGDWYYARSLGSRIHIIRFREKNGKDEIEAWPEGSNRFPPPPEDPLFVRASDGNTYRIVAGNAKGVLIVAALYRIESLRTPYLGFKDDGRILKPIGLKEAASQVFHFQEYANPIKVWKRLLSKGKAALRISRRPTEIEVDATNVWVKFDNERTAPKKLPYLQYEMTREGHAIHIRIPDFRHSIVAEAFRGAKRIGVDQIRRALSLLPGQMWGLARSITITPVPEGIIAGHTLKSGSAQFMRGGDIVLAAGAQKFATPLEKIIFHEIGHFFTEDVPRDYKRRLEAAIIAAIDEDGGAPYRSDAREDLKEVLAEGFEDFERAGPAMQRLILNLLLNPNHF